MSSEINVPETEKKRAGYGILGTVIIIIVVLVLLGWFVR
jgi:hypothetical protein